MDGPCRVSKCPIFCILKSVFVALLAIFVLYFPLGDPDEVCNTNKPHKQNIPMVGVCDFYSKIIKLFNKTKEVTELLACRALDLLYESKLKFYSVLNKMDGDDLYQSVCAKDDERNAEGAEQQRLCKCTRKCCSCKKKPVGN